MNKLNPFKWFVLQNFPFIEADFDALTNYELMCKVVEYLNETIAKTNELGNQVEVLTNWFNNLDVQDEVDHKLDEMAESGELTDIIAQYLQLAGLLCFNTKADMKSASNLSNGSFAKTYGTTTYKDGYGYFYKIREIENTDVVDDDNIIALANYNNLIAEKIPDARIEDIYNQLTTINKALDKLKSKIGAKLTITKNTYTPDFDVKGENFGLSYERMGQNSTSLEHQGLCVNKTTGEIYGNNATEIFKLLLTKPTTKQVVYDNLDLGHGGDCCIQDNKMYIIDSDENEIHIVDLSTGVDSVISIPYSTIENPNTTGTAVAGGICIEGDNLYINVNDIIPNDHTQIPTGSTLRIYKYNLTQQTYEKIFETENVLVYMQGMTADDDNFYIAGNKVFTSTYSGNRILVVNKQKLILLDIMENSHNSEYEGLDYCGLNGVEGLLTSINNFGSFSHIGVYAFYGNTTRMFEILGTTERKTITISRGGSVHVHYQLTENIQANTSKVVSNFLNNYIGIFRGTSGTPLIGIGIGQSRNTITQFEYDPLEDKFKIFPSQDITVFKCDFDFPC